jgi:hypothetical protein
VAEDDKALNPPTAVLEWLCAYRQALALLDRFDAEGLDCAERCDIWPEPSWFRFLDTYALKQGRYYSELRHKRLQVFGQLVPIFRPSLGQNGWLQQLQERWQEGVARLGRLGTQKRKNGNGPTLSSMASKLLWFYQPERMTMFDERARKGLAAVRREATGTDRGIKSENFLQFFEELFDTKQSVIERAAEFSDRRYPYPRRVLDQWLWLKGNDDSAQRLEAFRLSLEKAPILSKGSYSAPRLSPPEREAALSSLTEQILAISKHCAALPDRDLRSTEEILGYDERGVPR